MHQDVEWTQPPPPLCLRVQESGAGRVVVALAYIQREGWLQDEGLGKEPVEGWGLRVSLSSSSLVLDPGDPLDPEKRVVVRNPPRGLEMRV